MDSKNKSIRFVILASSVGTLIEWYDFFIFGTLATVIGKNLFPTDSGATMVINTLAIFAVGFIVRPFGALVFGRLGDLIGRKYTFQFTLIIMGGATFLIGCIPSFDKIGYLAPLLALILRFLQGLALGGEYGGAVTYIAEFAPINRKGFYTSWIQTTGTLGLFLSFGVIVTTKNLMSENQFNEWGWRIPFWISALLVIISMYIRSKMKESPLFLKIKTQNITSKNPLKESFTKKENFKLVLLVLFGTVIGQAVIGYTGILYVQIFLENIVKLEFNESRYILLYALFLTSPFFVIFGYLSDLIGRKWIMILGMILGVVTYKPIFQKFLDLSNVEKLDKTQPFISGTVSTNIEVLANLDTVQSISIPITLKNNMKYVKKFRDTISYNHILPLKQSTINYENKVLSKSIFLIFILLSSIILLYGTMLYGPIAAYIVEIFPIKIRNTSMALPFQVGNGIFGGLLPFIASLITSYNPANKLSGLNYPIIVSLICLIIAVFYMKNDTHKYSHEN